MRHTMLTIAAIASAATCVSIGEASAGRRSYGGDVVVAHSRFNHGSITAPVRVAPNGYDYLVRLPSGQWIKCRRSCSETLRVETVDLHEALFSNTAIGDQAAECGVLGCLGVEFGLPRRRY